jgi:hypothetical protein
MSAASLPSAAQFRAEVETMFQVNHPLGPIPLRLASMSDERVTGGFVFFSLFFHGPSDRLMPQGIYPMEHAVLGQFDLFIVPVLGSNHERIVYEAGFSRAVEGTR